MERRGFFWKFPQWELLMCSGAHATPAPGGGAGVPHPLSYKTRVWEPQALEWVPMASGHGAVVCGSHPSMLMTSTGRPVTGRPRGKVLATCADQTAWALIRGPCRRTIPRGNPDSGCRVGGCVPELWDAVPSRGTGISKELDPWEEVSGTQGRSYLLTHAYCPNCSSPPWSPFQKDWKHS